MFGEHRQVFEPVAQRWHTNHRNGQALVQIATKLPFCHGLLQPVGTFRFAKGKAGYVEIANVGTDGYVVIDAVQWLEAK